MAFAAGILFAAGVHALQAGRPWGALVWAAFLALAIWRWTRA
jgi:hypothetical protein